MPRKKEKIRKTVFFIVEGNTDKTALEKIFKAIYKHRDIPFEKCTLFGISKLFHNYP